MSPAISLYIGELKINEPVTLCLCDPVNYIINTAEESKKKYEK